MKRIVVLAFVPIALAAGGRLAADGKPPTKPAVAAAPVPVPTPPAPTPTPSGPAPTMMLLTNQGGAIGDTVKLVTPLLSNPPDAKAKFAGREVKFSVDGHEACTAKVEASNVASCSWKVPSMAQGVRPLEARFAGDGAWAASKASAQFLVVKAATKLWLDPNKDAQPPMPGTPLYFEASLTRTTDKEGIDGRLVTFNVNGQPAGKGTTVKGVAGLTYHVPKDFPGDVNIEAFFEGDNDYASSSDKHTYSIFHVHHGRLEIVSAPDGSVGQELTYRARLTEAGGSGVVSGQTIVFVFSQWDGRSWNEAWSLRGATDSSGVAHPTGKPPTTLGSVNVLVDPASSWVANEVTRGVSIGPSAVDISVPDRSGAIGRTVALQAHVTRASDGSPRKSTKVVFEIGGTPVGTDVTNASGDTTLSVKLTSVMGIGKHAVTARTAGDPDYKAGSGTGTITIGASQQ